MLHHSLPDNSEDNEPFSHPKGIYCSTARWWRTFKMSLLNSQACGNQNKESCLCSKAWTQLTVRHLGHQCSVSWMLALVEPFSAYILSVKLNIEHAISNSQRHVVTNQRQHQRHSPSVSVNPLGKRNHFWLAVQQVKQCGRGKTDLLLPSGVEYIICDEHDLPN